MLLNECKQYKDFYWQRAHLFYFNAKTLGKVVKNSNFEVFNISYVQRYSIENFMNWFMVGKPQIQEPIFTTKSTYEWLEDYYKNYLCKKRKSDTLVLIAKPLN